MINEITSGHLYVDRVEKGEFPNRWLLRASGRLNGYDIERNQVFEFTVTSKRQPQIGDAVTWSLAPKEPS